MNYNFVKKRSELKTTVWCSVLACFMFVSNETVKNNIKRWALFAAIIWLLFSMFADCPDFTDIIQTEENRINTTYKW